MEPPKHKRSFWSDLPPELLELVVQKLVLRDYLKIRQVCRQWRSTINDALETKKRCPPAPQFPSLLMIPSPLDPVVLCSRLFDYMQNKSQLVPTLAPEGYVEPLQSEEGWLMFCNPRDINTYKPCMLFWIFNPLSGKRYNLPLLPRPTSIPYYNFTDPYIRAAFSSAPDSSQNFLVVILISLGEDETTSQQLWFCRVTDKSWTCIEKLDSRSTYYIDVVLLGWKLYALNGLSVSVFDLSDPPAITVERLVMPLPKLDDRLGKTYRLARDSTCGEVLLVLIKSSKYKKIKGIHIFKLDMSGHRWIKIDDLGGCALFLDFAGVRVISTTGINGPPEFIGGNCVFLCVDGDLGVFFLKHKTRHFHFNPSNPSDQCLWFTPCPW